MLFTLAVALLIGGLGACGGPTASGAGIVGQWQYDLESTRSGLAETSSQRTASVDKKAQDLLRMIESHANHGYTMEFGENHTVSTWLTNDNGLPVTSEGTWRGQDGEFWMTLTKMSGVPQSMMGHPWESHVTLQGERLMMPDSESVPAFKAYMKRKSPGPSTPVSPAGTYRVMNVSEAVALAHAHSIAAINDVLKSLGNGATKEDEKAGLDELRKQDEKLTERLTTARVDLLPDGTFSWSPAPVTEDKEPFKVMAGRWSLADHGLTLAIERIDDLVWPWKVQIAATRDGDELRLGKLTGKLENSALEGVLLRRAPP